MNIWTPLTKKILIPSLFYYMYLAYNSSTCMNYFNNYINLINIIKYSTGNVKRQLTSIGVKIWCQFLHDVTINIQLKAVMHIVTFFKERFFLKHGVQSFVRSITIVIFFCVQCAFERVPDKRRLSTCSGNFLLNMFKK